MAETGSNIVGVGYQGTDVTAFVRRLSSDGVSHVVDVRLTPISRKRGLSKTSLAQHLSEAGIAYSHLKILGNPKWNRPGFGGTSAELLAARSNYANLLCGEDAQSALDRISDLALDTRVALLCFEADEQRCHRKVLLDILRRREPALASA